MKTLVTYIRESFTDSVLKEYFAYANKLGGETKRLLTSPILKTSANIDLHNVKSEEQSFDKDYNAASVKKYFNDIITTADKSNDWEYQTEGNVFIIKMQKDETIVFGLVACNDEKSSSNMKDFIIILPDDMNDVTNYVVYDFTKGYSKISKAIRQKWNVSVFHYNGNGRSDISDLFKLRKERKLNKQGVFDNTEEFLSYYKDKQVRNRLLTLIRNASKQVDPDYKAMLDDAKEQVDKLLKFVDVIDRVTKSAGRNEGIKNDSSLNSSLKQIDKNMIEATEILNSPEFYAGSFNRDRFQSRIDSIKSYIEDAYRDMEYATQDNFHK